MPKIVSPVAALVMAAAGLPALAERPVKQAPAEAMGSGLTVAERVASMKRLHAELTGVMPARAADERVYVDITPADREELAKPHVSGREPMLVGVVKAVPMPVGKRGGVSFDQGVLEERGDGSFVWAVTVTSQGAEAIRVHFTSFSLPAGTEVFFVGANGQADGPYVDRGRSHDGDFWSRSIASDTGTVLLRYAGGTPDIDRPRMSLVISEVGHLSGRPPRPQERSHDSWPCFDNAPCVVDAECNTTAAEALPARGAVAKMEWISGQFIYTCTGGLLADTDGSSQIPYFLTANHCLSSNIANLETFFNYTTDSCNGACPDSLVTGGTPPLADTVGVTVRASGSAGDFTLLTLNEAPPAGATFLGWNNAPIANTNGANLYRISNPNFGPQAYSQHDVTTSSPTCSGWPRGERIYSVDQVGATMGGSSGSPVLNAASQVVGQLSGCCGFNCGNECDAANNWTVDGALAFYWSQVADFLDPPGGGCTTNAECNDGLFCTGTETCVGGACQSSGNPCAGGATCNEATDTCDAPVCNNDGVCGAGEDCTNCPGDCRARTGGNPSGRYCCDGDLADCGDARCNQEGWVCGDSMCTTSAECDDGLFCNGSESCAGGSCQAGTNPCPGQGCNESTNQCTTCAPAKAQCSVNSDCCSNNCRNGTCKGN